MTKFRFSTFKKTLSLAIAFMLTMAMFTGCGEKPPVDTPSSKGEEPVSSAAPAEKSKVLLWHLWTADGEEKINAAVAEYNSMSDKYEVEPLSVPDTQKIIAAISAGTGPDISDDFNGSIGNYASKGVYMPLDDYIKKTNYDLSDFIPSALDSCKYEGKLYAMPCSVNFMGLYYNKTLLKEAGYDNPPQTLEEMYEMAVKTTKVNADKTVDICGFPDFPFVYYATNFVTAAGGGWYTKEGKPAPADTEGNKIGIQLAVDYRTKFGLDNVIKFQSAGKYLDPTDPFLAGKQVFRVDGPWMGQNLKDVFKSDVDYGVTFIPYPKDKPELAKRGLTSCSMFYIPAKANNPEGAWDFMQYIVGQKGQVTQTIAAGGFPSRFSLLENESFKKSYDSAFYSELARSKNLQFTPNTPFNTEYNTLVSEQVELAVNLKQSVEQSLKNIYDQAQSLFN